MTHPILCRPRMISLSHIPTGHKVYNNSHHGNAHSGKERTVFSNSF